MTEELTITTERVDDIPLLLSQLNKLEIASLIDRHFSVNGNWRGLSLGKVVTGWLCFILSQYNHRLNHVRPWAEQRMSVLQSCLSQDVRGLDFTDDRLASALDYLSKDCSWEDFETQLGQHSLRVYDLQARRVRVDATTTKSYVEVNTEGLFQFGHSKDRRPDLPQVKINMSVLDELGLPLTTTVVAGNSADDPLYVPEIVRVQRVLGEKRGVTYIGDCKMAALQTRAYLEQSKDYYLCPLPSVQLPQSRMKELLRVVEDGSKELEAIYSNNDKGKDQKIAEGYEYEEQMKAVLSGNEIVWQERRLVVRSLKMAEKQQNSLRARIAKAIEEIEAFNERKQGKKIYRIKEELEKEVEKVLKKNGVCGLLKLSYLEEVSEETIRGYGKKARRIKEQKIVGVKVEKNNRALQEEIFQMGWRVYATNQGVETLTLLQAVKAYRGQYVIEHRIGRLKGKQLSLSPLYLSNEDRVKGLIRLLTIALRVLTLIEFQVRTKLEEEKRELSGIYAGNRKRGSGRPTTETMLKAFEYVTLTEIEVRGQTTIHLTPLNKTQETILSLLGLPFDTYLSLNRHSSKLILNLSEP